MRDLEKRACTLRYGQKVRIIPPGIVWTSSDFTPLNLLLREFNSDNRKYPGTISLYRAEPEKL